MTRLQGFPERLEHTRKARAMTQVQLASMSNVALSSLRNWEHGRNEPTLTALVSLAKVLGVSTDYLLGNCENDTNIRD